MAMTLNILHIIWSIVFVLIFFGFCIFIHEFGHLVAAFWRGLHVERFSVGFGRPLKKWRYKDIDFQLGWLPLGGYVALPQLEPTDQPKTHDGKPLSPVKPLDRIIVAFAGPLFNVLFALFLGTIIWQVGIEKDIQEDFFIVGHVPESYMDKKNNVHPNPEYGIVHVRDKVVKVNGTRIKDGWSHAVEIMLFATSNEMTLDILRDGEPAQVTYLADKNPNLENLFYPFFSKKSQARVRSLIKDSPAERAGLRNGDVFVAINGIQIHSPGHLVEQVNSIADNAINLTMLRDGKELVFTGIIAEKKVISQETKAGSSDTPEAAKTEKKEKVRYFIGAGLDIVPPPQKDRFPTPWESCRSVVTQTYKTLSGVVNPNSAIGVENMSSAVGIFYYLFLMVYVKGFIHGLNLVLIVSVSLAIINLFPIPLLDGGHIMFSVIECITRRRVPARIEIPLQYICASLLIGFVLFVTFYDVQRVWSNVKGFF